MAVQHIERFFSCQLIQNGVIVATIWKSLDLERRPSKEHADDGHIAVPPGGLMSTSYLCDVTSLPSGNGL